MAQIIEGAAAPVSESTVQKCLACGYTNQGAEELCAACGSSLRLKLWRDVMPLGGPSVTLLVQADQTSTSQSPSTVLVTDGAVAPDVVPVAPAWNSIGLAVSTPL